MKFICAAENLAGTSMIQAYVKIIPVENKDNEATTQPDSKPTTKAKDAKPYVLRNLCGTMGGGNVTLLKPALSSPTTYKKVFAPYGVTVLFEQKRKFNAISVHVTGTNEHNDLVQVCHTHGPHMLYRTVHLSPPKDLMSINVYSLSVHYLLCVEIPAFQGEMCGNFTVLPTPRDNMMVMFIVGGFLLSIAVIPLMLGFCHAWKEDRANVARNGMTRHTVHGCAKSTKRTSGLLNRKKQAEQNTQKMKTFRKNSKPVTETPDEENKLIETTSHSCILSHSSEKRNSVPPKSPSFISEEEPSSTRRENKRQKGEHLQTISNQASVERWLKTMQPEEWSQFTHEDSNSVENN